MTVSLTQNAAVPSGLSTLETSFQTFGYSNQWHDCAAVLDNLEIFRREDCVMRTSGDQVSRIIGEERQVLGRRMHIVDTLVLLLRQIFPRCIKHSGRRIDAGDFAEVVSPYQSSLSCTFPTSVYVVPKASERDEIRMMKDWTLTHQFHTPSRHIDPFLHGDRRELCHKVSLGTWVETLRMRSHYTQPCRTSPYRSVSDVV